MMLPKRLAQALNNHLTNELQASHSYTGMAAYFSHLRYKGFANFWLVQAEEEREHAMKFYHFLVTMGQQPILQQLEKPDSTFNSPLEVAQRSLEQEKEVTKNIYDLSDMASELEEHSTKYFLQWFIDEQMEEEETFVDIITKLEGIKPGGDFFLAMDKEFSERKLC